MALQAITFPTKPIVKTHLIINCVLVFIAVCVVGLRMIARIVSAAQLWWDDFLILLAVPQGIAMLVIQGLYLPMGVGYPMSEAGPNVQTILKMLLSYAFIYTFCISTIKLSVLCFYLRVFVNKDMRIATKVAIVFVSLWTIANLLLLILICQPFSLNYSPSPDGSGKCGDQPAAFVSIGAFNIISDVLILALPIPTVWTLNMRLRMKIALTIIFLVGLLVSVVAVLRIIALTHVSMEDITGNMVWVDFLYVAEVNLGILCVSLPMLAPLYSRWRKTRGASKLENQDPSGQSKRADSKLSSNKKQLNQETITLESIYAHNMEACHVATVSASRDHGDAMLSQSGSDTALSPISSGDNLGGAILVQNQWTIHRS